MPEEQLVRYCAPTLAGLKTGSLFSCRCRSKTELLRRLRAWNLALRPKGISVLPLRWTGRRALVYVVRPAALETDLAAEEVRLFLHTAGYPAGAPRCVAELKRRLNTGAEFPHEIGLFLGYPAEDVRGFIEHGGSGCRSVGAWKVYGDVERAEALFRRYRACTAACLTRLAGGAALETLAVNTGAVSEQGNPTGLIAINE